ncbi:sulfotransferase [Gemmatimonadota bacterium]
MKERRIILVTGSPRSGTTAVGQALSEGVGVCNLHEPFNYHVGLRSVRRYFEIPGSGGFTDGDLAHTVESIRLLRLRYRPGVFPGEPALRRLAKRAFGGRAVTWYRRCRFSPGIDTIIWKDPFACFFAANLAEDHDVQVIVTLRNPWAVAGSFKRMGWAFDLADIHSRLSEAGVPGVCALDPDTLRTRDPVRNGAAIWTLVYGVLEEANRQFARQVRFLDLDSVVADPVPTFMGLYRDLDLPWSPRVERRIRRRYVPREDEVSAPRTPRAHDQRRNLGEVNTYWRQLLDDDETEVVTKTSGSLWERLHR